MNRDVSGHSISTITKTKRKTWKEGFSHVISVHIRFWDLGSISPIYLHTPFTHVTPKSVRIQSSRQCLFMHLGSAHKKAALTTLMKLTPGINFINAIHTAFMRTYPRSSRKTVKLPVASFDDPTRPWRISKFRFGSWKIRNQWLLLSFYWS